MSRPGSGAIVTYKEKTSTLNEGDRQESLSFFDRKLTALLNQLN